MSNSSSGNVSVMTVSTVSTTSSAAAKAVDQQTTIRKHNLYMSCAMACVSVICIILQAVEAGVLLHQDRTVSARSLHFYNGFWLGVWMLLTAIFGIMSCLEKFLPFMDPLINQQHINATHWRRKLPRMISLFLCILTIIVSIAAMVVSCRAYTSFPVAELQKSLDVLEDFADTPSKKMTRANQIFQLRRLRKLCLTLQALLIFFLALGIFITVFNTVITMNRISEPIRRRQLIFIPKAAPEPEKPILEQISSHIRKISRRISSIVRPTFDQEDDTETPFGTSLFVPAEGSSPMRKISRKISSIINPRNRRPSKPSEDIPLTEGPPAFLIVSDLVPTVSRSPSAATDNSNLPTIVNTASAQVHVPSTAIRKRGVIIPVILVTDYDDEKKQDEQISGSSVVATGHVKSTETF